MINIRGRPAPLTTAPVTAARRRELHLGARIACRDIEQRELAFDVEAGDAAGGEHADTFAHRAIPHDAPGVAIETGQLAQRADHEGVATLKGRAQVDRRHRRGPLGREAHTPMRHRRRAVLALVARVGAIALGRAVDDGVVAIDLAGHLAYLTQHRAELDQAQVVRLAAISAHDCARQAAAKVDDGPREEPHVQRRKGPRVGAAARITEGERETALAAFAADHTHADGSAAHLHFAPQCTTGAEGFEPFNGQPSELLCHQEDMHVDELPDALECRDAEAAAREKAEQIGAQHGGARALRRGRGRGAQHDFSRQRQRQAFEGLDHDSVGFFTRTGVESQRAQAVDGSQGLHLDRGRRDRAEHAGRKRRARRSDTLGFAGATALLSFGELGGHPLRELDAGERPFEHVHHWERAARVQAQEDVRARTLEPYLAWLVTEAHTHRHAAAVTAVQVAQRIRQIAEHVGTGESSVRNEGLRLRRRAL